MRPAGDGPAVHDRCHINCHRRASAKKGEPGYCDEKLEKIPDADFDYTPDTPDDVGVDKAWGFCDKKCFASKRTIMANILQQACRK